MAITVGSQQRRFGSASSDHYVYRTAPDTVPTDVAYHTDDQAANPDPASPNLVSKLRQDGSGNCVCDLVAEAKSRQKEIAKLLLARDATDIPALCQEHGNPCATQGSGNRRQPLKYIRTNQKL